MAQKIQGHAPNKGLGQNFLQDAHVISQIIQAIDPNWDDAIIEIGPGLGALTLQLLPHLKELAVIEIDTKLAKKWQTHEKVKWLAADALQFDLDSHIPTQSSKKIFKIVGNLPYHISSPLLFHYLQFKKDISKQCFMLQKEVIDRILANHDEKDYGRLSIILQANYKMHRVLDVPPEAFFPPPKVHSSVVVMQPKAIELAGIVLNPQEEQHFNKLLGEVTQLCFSQRRKMLRAIFKNHATNPLAEQIQAICLDLSLDLTQRPENISAQEYIKITEKLYAK